jgi:HPt (histidine-containing phosphotransfer) domain-containing protein
MQPVSLPASTLPSSAASSALVFERAALLECLMDDEELAGKVIAGFLDDMPGQIEKLRRCLDVSDAPGAERQAHLLKGAAATVGGEALRALAGEMEKAGRTGDLASVAAGMDDLELQFLRLKEAMTKEG